MKKSLIAILFAALAFFLQPLAVNASYSDPLPNSSCTAGTLKIYIRPQGVGGLAAVRIDDRANGWGGDTVLSGDLVDNSFKGSAYVWTSAVVGDTYNWWYHDINSTGVYSAAKGGAVYCYVGSPTNLTATYSYPSLTLKWSPVNGAAHYAIRVDNSINPWNPANMQGGDHLSNSLNGTTYVVTVPRGRKVYWWVHAIDKNGIYSNATAASFTTQ